MTSVVRSRNEKEHLMSKGQRFSSDGRQILFVSDMSGYGNLYLIDTPDFDALPEMTAEK
jgi:Tol biopolymer transport system component